jgi:outer membrane protein assembly factor BamB
MAASLLALGSLVGCTRLGVPQGWPTGAVEGNALYTGTMDGELRALDTATGEIIWLFPLRGEENNRAVYGTPAIANGVVYFGGYDGILYALSLDDGSEVWDTTVGDSRPIVGGPVVAGGLVLVGSSDGNLYAFAITTGSLEWSFQTSNGVWSAPAVSDGVVYFGSLNHNVYAVDLEDGTEIWSFPAKGAVTATPVVFGGRVYVGSFASMFFALDAETGDEVWRFDGADNWYWGGAVADESTIYAPSLDGKVYALDIHTGELRWSLQADGPIVGSPAIVAGRLAVASADGRVRLVRLSDGLDERQCNLDAKLRASLAVQGNVLYVSADDHSIRALAVKPNGNPDEVWVHYSNEEDPVPQNPIRVC